MPSAPYIPFAISVLARIIGIPESTTAVGASPGATALVPTLTTFSTPSTHTLIPLTCACQ